MLDEATWEAYQLAIPVMLGIKRNRNRWMQVGRRLYDPEFIEMVDRLVEGQPFTDFYDKVFALE